jgi:cyclase
MKRVTGARLLFAAVLTTGAGFAQANFFGAKMGGVDLTGDWFPVRGQDAGLETAAGNMVDYGGLPINEASRLYGLAWNASRITLRQHQCPGYVPPYFYLAPGNYRFWEERDPHTQALIAIKMYGQIAEGTRTIWMDGRPHPPAYAQHTFSGFSTGKYEGNMLVAYTTHIKRGWIRAAGMAQSDQATIQEYFVRHGDRITYFSVTTDPVFLAEPMSKTVILLRSPRDPSAWLYACDDGEQIIGRPPDVVPNYLWGQHPFLREFADKNHVPLLGALGGPETTSPEFLAKLKDPAGAEAAAKAELLPAGPRGTSRALESNPHDGEIHVLPVQGGIYMLVGDGANIAVQVGDEGPLVVDTGAGELSDKVIAAIRKLSDQPIQFIVNTSVHLDRIGGNVKLRASGLDPSLFGSFFSGQFPDAGKGATIIAHQNVQTRLSAPGQSVKVAEDGWPSDTFLKERRRKYHNGEAVEIFYQPNAITDGDSIVQFRRSDVIVTGDIVDLTRYPFIDIKNGGTVQGEIRALNEILDRTVYKHDEEDGTLIVPARGRLCDEWEVTEYRDMVAIIRDRVQALVKNGATLDQVTAARVTADYDNLYGATSGPWTTDMFVDAIYTSLKQPSLGGSQ